MDEDTIEVEIEMSELNMEDFEIDDTPYMQEDYDFRNEEAAAEQMAYEEDICLE